MIGTANPMKQMRYQRAASKGDDFEIDPSSSVPIYVQIIDQIRGAVVDGRLAAGDPLPSIRHLATKLKVSPNTVVQAYRELEREGISYVERGQGTFIADTAWLEQRAEHLRLGKALMSDLLEKTTRLGLSPSEVRSLLERCLVNRAA